MRKLLVHKLKTQDWRNAATIGGIVAVVGSTACAMRVPESFGMFMGIALVGVIVAMASEKRR